MLLSHQKKFIFIHIPKTAGTSITGALVPYCRWIDRVLFGESNASKAARKVIDVAGNRIKPISRLGGFHKHAKAFQIRAGMDQALFDSYFKFAIVRDPYDLVVSMYFFLRQDKYHPMHKDVVQMDFAQFVPFYLSSGPSIQTDFLMDKDKKQLIVDYVGHFETLAEDVQWIFERIGVAEDRGLTHKNPSVGRKGRSYRELYTADVRELVENYYRSDFEELGYQYQRF